MRLSIIQVTLLCLSSLPLDMLLARNIVYDAAGRVIWTIQPSGQATTFTYDANGNIESIATVIPSVDTDNDGIPDYYEIQYASSVTSLDPSLDEDNDRNNNLSEFAFALRASEADGFQITPISITPPDSSGDSFFTIKYIRPQTGTLHLSYETEISFNLLQPWITGAPAVVETVVVQQEQGVEEVTVKFLVPVSSNTEFFMRVEATPLP